MALQFLPLLFMGAGTYAGSAYYNQSAMQSPDFVPRMGNMQTDSRYLGLGLGLASLLAAPLLGPFAFLAPAGIGLGVAAAVNYNTMGNVQAGVQQFMSRQALGPAAAPFALPGSGARVPDYVRAVAEGLRAPV